MALKGDKIGDGYIDVHLVTDEKSVKANEKRIQKSIDKELDANIAAQKSYYKQKEKAASADLDHSIKLIMAKEKRESEALSHSIRLIEGQERLQAKIDREEKARLKEATRLKEREENRAERALREATRKSEFAHRESLRQIREERSERDKSVKEAERAAKRFDKILSGGNGPRRGSNNRGNVISSTAKNISSILPGQIEKIFQTPAIAAIGAAIGVEILGQAAAAITTGIALGELGGGIALAISKDPELQAAGKELGSKLFSGMQDAAHDTLAPEIRKAFDQIDDSGFVEKIQADFREIFSNLGPSLVPLVSDLETGISTITGALKDLSLNGGEFIGAFGDGFVQVSNAVAGFLNDLKDNEGGLKLLLGDIFATISGIVRALGKAAAFAAQTRQTIQSALTGEDKRSDLEKAGGAKALPGLADTYRGYQERAKKMIGSDDPSIVAAGQQLLVSSTKQLNDVLALQTSEYNKQRDAALKAAGANEEVTKAQEELTAAVAEATKVQRAHDDAVYASIKNSIDYANAEAELKKEFATGTKEISLRTPEARKNYEAVNDQIKAARDQAAAIQESGGSAADANKKFKALTDKIITDTGAKGKNKEAIQGIIKKYGEFQAMPNEVKDIKIQVTGADKARNTFDALTKPEQKIIKIIAKKSGKSESEVTAALEKNKARGGAIRGPGTSTSDSIPANLSNGEFVMKASAVNRIGVGTLNAMNSGHAQGFAKGGSVGNGRGSSKSEVAQYNALLKEIAALTKTINNQSAALTKYTDQIKSIGSALDNNTNLGGLEGGSAGDVIKNLQSKKKQNTDFEANLKSLSKKGLSKQGLEQLAAAGPDSDIGRLLAKGASAADIKMINELLGGDAAEGQRVADIINPGGAKLKSQQAAAKKKLDAKKKKAAKLKPVKGKGATIKYVNGKPQAFFSSKELANQNLQTNTYVTVTIDGKEVRAIVKKEQSASTKKNNSKLKSGKR